MKHVAMSAGVLDLGTLARLIQNARILRQEIKCSNVKVDDESVAAAWEMIEYGLLAQQYVILFVDSLSSTSFYSIDMPSGKHDGSHVLDIEEMRQEFVESYQINKPNPTMHPVMREMGDKECRSTVQEEVAHIASVSQIHHCIG